MIALPLHLPTVTLICCVLYGLLALVVWIILDSRHRARWPVRLWSIGALSMSLGLSLVALRAQVPAWVSFQLANTLLVGAHVMRVFALRSDLGWRPRWALGLGLWALVMAGYELCLLWPAPVVRVSYGYATHVIGTAAVGVHALALGRAWQSRNAYLLAGTAAALSITVAVRLLAILLGWADPVPLGQTLDYALLAAVGVAAALFSNLGYVGLVIDRNHDEAQRAREAQLGEQLRREAAEQSADRLRELLAQRDALAAQRDRLLRVLAHEVRQPLHNANSALQSAALALRHGGGVAVVSRLERAQAVLAEVRSALDNTLAAATLLSRHGPITRQEVDLELLIDLTVQDLDGAQQARVQVERPADLRTAELDHTLMRLALRNLLRNALMHGGADAAVTLRVGEQDAPPALLLEVLDDGPGLPAARLQTLASPGIDEPRADQGLGLFIVRQVLALHQGRLELQARQPHGLLARMVLPQGLADTAAA